MTSEPAFLSFSPFLFFLSFFFFKIFFSTFIYFWDRERQSMNGGGAEREGDTESETGSRLWAISPEPDAGLELTDRENSQTARSWPGWSWTLNRLRHPGAPKILFLSNLYTQCGCGSNSQPWDPRVACSIDWASQATLEELILKRKSKWYQNTVKL